MDVKTEPVIDKTKAYITALRLLTDEEISKITFTNYNNRRQSLPVTFNRNHDTEQASRQGDIHHNVSNNSLDTIPLGALDHLEILLKDMNDFCGYGSEILNVLKEEQTTTLDHEIFKYLYNKNKELKSKITQLKELNDKLFDEIFNYINETGIFIESNVITSDIILERNVPGK